MKINSQAFNLNFLKQFVKKLRFPASEKGEFSIDIILILGMILFFAILLGSGLFFRPSIEGSASIQSSFACCDSGNGAACVPNMAKTFLFRGETYALLKSNFGVPSKDLGGNPPWLHFSYTEEFTPTGQRIYLNSTDTTGIDPHPPACRPGDHLDWFLGGDKGCYGLANDIVIYACTLGSPACDEREGRGGKFDAYYRVRDGVVPDAISNCLQPDTQQLTTGSSQQVLQEPMPPKRDVLQLYTFTIKETPPSESWIVPYCKPAIYLYPEEKTLVNVSVKPLGKMLLTIPQYPPGGWTVTASPEGNIEYQKATYDYLYYEAEIPDGSFIKPKEGFVIPFSELESFFYSILPRLGLNQKETEQFATYWLKVLPVSPYYFIGVMSQRTLDAISPLTISPSPATTIRVSLYFEPLDEKVNVGTPQLLPRPRSGFTVVEWGGLFKSDKDHKFSCFM